MFSAGAGTWTIPVTGKWRYIISARINDHVAAAGDTTGIFIYNGVSNIAQFFSPVDTTGRRCVSFNGTIVCTSGDVLTIQMLQQSGVTLTAAFLNMDLEWRGT